MHKAPEPVRRWTWPHYYISVYLTGIWMRIMGGFVVRGRQYLPRKGGAVVCANHVSYLDPPVLGGAILPRRTYFMAKIELFKIPGFSLFIRKHYAFPVDRNNADREAIRFGIELLQKGELLVVFPEGGRSPDGSLQRGNFGPALMASKAGVPIIPAAIKETNKVMPPKGGLHRGRVQVDFGEPIDPKEFGGTRLGREPLGQLTERLMSSIYELQKQQHERVGEVAPPRTKEPVDAE